MTARGSNDPFRIGFLLSCQTPDGGHVGGLLVTNHLGRPLEFQCTTPVKPNRTQEILYGPTLVPFVLTELLGRTLLDRIGVKPHAIFIDRPELLELRTLIEIPVFQFVDESAAVLEAPTQGELGLHTVSTHAAHADDLETIAPRLRHLPASADLREPFERVRDALGEALKAA